MLQTSTLSRRERMKLIRRKIHARPELAFEETETSDLVASELLAMGLDVDRGLAGTGVVATLSRGTQSRRRSVGLRADMDALPIHEAGNCEHKSTVDGIMHACGHDGHTAMLLGAAETLVKSPDFEGTVHFIFQPAEEGRGGGRRMVEDGLFEKFPCNAVFALHNWPGLSVGKIAVRPGAMMASMDTFTVTIQGFGGHAAMPERARDPIPVGCEIVSALQTIISRKISPHESAVLTVTQFQAGDSYNVIPDKVELKGTVRCYDEDVRGQIEQEILLLVRTISHAHGVSADARYDKGYPSTLNSEAEARFAAKIAQQLVGKENVDTDFTPSMASEDFSFMLNTLPGAYLWLGAGASSRPLHHPEYDFNDELLETGADLLASLARGYLEQSVRV